METEASGCSIGIALEEECNKKIYSRNVGILAASDLSQDDKKLLEWRSEVLLREDSTVCFHHEKMYLSKYKNTQRYCSDPFKLHKKRISNTGDHNLFSSLQSGLISSLPQESVEWRRSFGRPTRCVHVEVDFVPYSEELVTKEPERTILGHPVFHTYWTDCPDVETYKNNVREHLQSWVHNLRQHGKSDWMVVLVETPDTKKSNKLLPRTTVLDKLKNDFGGKQSERCVSLIDPTKSDSRSIESWQLLLSKMRHLIMVAFNRALNKFEESMRAERERRTEKNWSFCRYFILQEELAHVFKLLSLHDEALVQYDELDALFTQFILNSAAGDTPQWLSNFSQPCTSWEGLYLSKNTDFGLREKIRDKSISLLEFRNYLFQCQSILLIKQNKPWELASRSLNFLQNTLGELRILEVSIEEGGLACWGFLSCLEVIQLLAKYKDPTTTDSHALHTAPLWAYARDKLKELGHLCGLMPGGKTSSEQLHTVISLVCGMGNDPHTQQLTDSENEEDNMQMSPMTRLKEALSSQEAFKKHFLDLSEVAISTYKHIGRIRSARLIGRDLALFYLKEGSLHQAATFLSDQLKTFLEEGWDLLTAHTQQELAKCYLTTGDTEKYLRTCVQLAACPVESYKQIRIKAFDDMMKMAESIEEGKTLPISSERILEIGWMKVISNGRIVLGSEVKVELVIHSHLPVSLRFDKIEVQLKHNSEKVKRLERLISSHVGRPKGNDVERKGSTSSAASHSSSRRHSSATARSGGSDGAEGPHSRHPKTSSVSVPEEDDQEEPVSPPVNPFLKQLQMEFYLDYKQDKSLSTVSMNCNNVHKALRRDDSLSGIENIEKIIIKEDFTDCLSVKNLTINPGINTIHLKTKVSRNGHFVGGQVVLLKDKLEFICNRNLVRGKHLVLEVINESPQVFLARKERELLAGILQPLILTIKSGSSHITEGTEVTLKCSRGLQIGLDEKRNSDDDPSDTVSEHPLAESELKKEIEVKLPAVQPFSHSTIQLKAMADLVPQKDASTIEHSVCITSGLLEDSRHDVDIHFIPPFMASHKLHSANLKKFLQVSISGIVKQPMELLQPKLEFVDCDDHPPLKLLNDPDQILVVCIDQSGSYMWEMDVDYSQKDSPHLKAQFSLDYRLPKKTQEERAQESKAFKCVFDVQNYKTLYTVRARVEPAKGSEFCRAGNMCHFHIAIQHVETKDSPDGLFKKRKDTPAADLASSPPPESPTPTVASNSLMYEVITDQTMWAVCGRTSGVLSLDLDTKQTVMLDVMPLIGGFLPLPAVRLSKYIPAETKQMTRDGRKSDIVGTASSVPRLEPFSPGQVYNFSKALQVHVLPASNVQADSGLS